MTTTTKLTRDLVVQTAIGLADGEGIAALTMRHLAQELGVEAMSLYHHVANKDDLLAEMLDAVVLEMAHPVAGGDWKAELRRGSESAHDVLVRHPWSAALLLAGPRVSQPRQRHMDAILGCLRGAGFSAEMTDHAYHALDSHIMGFTLWEVGISAGMQQLGSVATFLDQLDVSAMPHLAEHIGQHLKERDPEAEGEFSFGLGLILDGLERILESGDALDARGRM